MLIIPILKMKINLPKGEKKKVNSKGETIKIKNKINYLFNN